jgi:GNAT superfamily N-acetyltransferase
MPLEIVRMRPEYLPQVVPIVFEAFRNIQEHHRFPLDIPSVEVAGMMMQSFALRPDMYGVVALLDGKVVGSNFTQISDPVSGVGPITVDVSQQAHGVGRALMQNIIDWSLANHGPMVRLVQESFNMRSISLYTSLGFTAVEPLVLMEVKPAEREDPTVRKLTAADLPACDALCQAVQKVSRKNELALMIEHGSHMGFIPHGRFKGNSLTAYVIPGFVGHTVGQSVEDLLTTVTQAARSVPPHVHRMFIPVRHGELFRAALKLKMRCLKPMTLMAMGPYEQPTMSGAAWSPSIAY